MTSISTQTIQNYRAKTYRLLPGERVRTREQAVDFVNQRGYVYFWPITGITMPSLWAAVAGDRPVADAHDDPGHITWGWKDALLGGRDWYYAKVLRRKATMISFAVAPYFYALSENYGSPEEDYLTLYEQGRLTQEAKLVYEVLLDQGPMDTVALRKAAHLSSRNSESRFNRALADLQSDFKILPVAVTQAGAWHYAFAYDIVARHYLDLPEQAHSISQKEARRKLAELYFYSVGVAQLRDLTRLFGWSRKLANGVTYGLIQEGILCRSLEIQNQPGEWFALCQLVEKV